MRLHKYGYTVGVVYRNGGRVFSFAWLPRFLDDVEPLSNDLGRWHFACSPTRRRTTGAAVGRRARCVKHKARWFGRTVGMIRCGAILPGRRP